MVSTYVHSGTVGHPSMDDKHAFLALATERMAELLADRRRVVVGGDLNIAHTDADLKNCQGQRRQGRLPAGGARLADPLVRRGLGGRGPGPAGDVPGPYTWWSWRGKAFDNDAGWRIDYQVASPALAGAVRDVRVDRAPAYDQRFSDHAPLVVDYDG